MGRKVGSKNPNAGRKKIPLIMEIPPKEIIFDQVLYWINLQATQEEIAGLFRISVDTLNRRLVEHFALNFAELRKRVDGEAKLSLRRFQFKQAEKNSTMAIWLGKIWLGQKEDLMDELKDWMIHEMRAGIKQISEESRSEVAIKPKVAPEQSLPDS